MVYTMEYNSSEFSGQPPDHPGTALKSSNFNASTRLLTDHVRLRCGQTLPNRLMKSALSEALAGRDGSPSVKHERLYRQWSTGGYGLVVTGNVMVDSRHRGEPGNVVIEDDRHANALSRWSKTFHDATDAPLWVQINHPGRQANSIISSTQPVAPSPIGATMLSMTRPRELRSEEIEDIIERYATTATVLEATGFQGVQVHGAHGYLVTQFLSPQTNQRDDEWGGDPVRRRRFLLEVVRRIRSRVSPGFAVSVKLNSADYQRGGFTEDESREVVRALVAEEIDLIEISGGNYESPAMMGRVSTGSTAEREAYFLDYAETVQRLAADVPIAVTGGFRTHAAMRAAVGSGACDVIGLGRPAVVIPDAPYRLLVDNVHRLHATGVQAGLRRTLGRAVDLKQLDSVLDLQWHTDQLARMARGKSPDPYRPWWRTIITIFMRNGRAGFGRKRR